MRKYLIIPILILCMAASVEAHKPADSVGFWPYFTAEREFAVYTEAAHDSEITATLKPGADVSVKEYRRQEKIGNTYVNWYSITYVQGDEAGAGFVYTPDGLVNQSLMYGEKRFIYQVDADTENYLAAITLKAFDKNGKLLSQTPAVEVSLAVTNNIYFTALDSDGLENVEFVAQLYMTAEACGYPIYELFYAWVNDRFVQLPEAITMGGEGIYTSYEEKVVLPAGGAPYNTIVRVVCVYEPLDEDDYRTKDSFAAEIFRWDGAKAVSHRQDQSVLNWRKTEPEE